VLIWLLALVWKLEPLRGAALIQNCAQNAMLRTAPAAAANSPLGHAHQEKTVSEGGSPFWKMPLPDADNCGEWQVTTKGRTWILAKLVGDKPAAILFSDIATTIDGLGLNASAKSLVGCGTAGGQMGAIFNTTDPYYESQLFDGFTSKGILIKIVKAPSDETSTSSATSSATRTSFATSSATRTSSVTSSATSRAISSSKSSG